MADTKTEWCRCCQNVEKRYVTFSETGVNLGMHRQMARLMMGGEEELLWLSVVMLAMVWRGGLVNLD